MRELMLPWYVRTPGGTELSFEKAGPEKIRVTVDSEGPFTELQVREVEDFVQDAIDTTLGYREAEVVWPGAK